MTHRARGRAPIPCPVSGCPELQPCEEHGRKPWASSRRKEHRAGSGWDESASAKRILRRDRYTCQIQGPGCLGHASECDHRVPLSVTGPAGDHDGNKQAACRVCHKAKTEAEKQAGRARSRRESC